jgi:hypothetical protein
MINMKISGFTFVRNAGKLYFPVKESISSVLPLVDEFIIALGDNAADDDTEAQIRSIGSEKIKIIHRQWDEDLFKNGLIFAAETNFALSQCTGDWCFYIQADEVIHEDDHAEILDKCTRYLEDDAVDGFLFNYLHFWGDYDHLAKFHNWYSHEIRIVRNGIGVQSLKDAQSFRINGEEKLQVVRLNARVFHYGWVRPPHLMQNKEREQHGLYFGRKSAAEAYKQAATHYQYGPLGRMPLFKGTHPVWMKERIAQHNWKDKLDYGKKLQVTRHLVKHERTKYRILSFIENNLLGGRQMFGYRNWKVVK